ncbi:hypothetical protein JB92DRAFT_3128317 [Gautieria morchelliformis]|nr:hypothetical protein JB92DRAFT_3128317 [Gautieria morchelliformis]
MAPAATKRKALQEINLTQLPTRSTVLKKTSTHEDSSSRTRPRDEGLGDEEIAEFLSDPNANDSEDEPGPQTCPGRIQAKEFVSKATMAVVTAASKPSVSNAVRRQTASSPVPLQSVTRDAAQTALSICLLARSTS